MAMLTAAEALGAAQRRFTDAIKAGTVEDQALVISEMVMWLWMLGDSFGALETLSGPERQILNGLYHARHKGLHQAISLGETSDGFSDYFTEMFGVPVWAKLPPARSHEVNEAQEDDYKQLLEGRIVFDSLKSLMATLHEEFGTVTAES